MTIRLPKKSIIEKLLNWFGYFKRIDLPEDYDKLRERFGPYVHIQAIKSKQADDKIDIQTELALLTDKLIAVSIAIEGLNEKSNDTERDAATYGLSSMVTDLSKQVAGIHAAYEDEIFSGNRDIE